MFRLNIYFNFNYSLISSPCKYINTTTSSSSSSSSFLLISSSKKCTN
ncbi:hypothetical protein K7X86_00520 [Candidatus Sulcia muelleri]|nr:hypothetical protein [Candidatus Karelsulcia muelleri]